MLGTNNGYSVMICRSASSVKRASSERESVIGRGDAPRAQVDADFGDDAGLLELSVDNRVGVIVAFPLTGQGGRPPTRQTVDCCAP